MIAILLHLGSLTIHSYGLMMWLGIFAAGVVCTGEFKRRGYKGEWAVNLVVWSAISGIVGSRIYDIIDNWPHYAANPWDMIFSGAGFVWYGGLMGGAIGSFFVARYYPIPWLVLTQMTVAGADRYGGAGSGDWPCHRAHRMPAVWRWRLGHGLQPALGDGLSQRDCGMERPDRTETGQPQSSRIGIPSGRASPPGSAIRNNPVHRGFPRAVVASEKASR